VSEQDNVSRAALGVGSYEVWFLTFTDPGSGRGYWIRSTSHAPAGGRREGGVWFAQFDPVDTAATFGIHRATSKISVASDRFEVQTESSTMTSGHAEGSVEGGEHEVQWNLEWPTGEPTYLLLPPALYRGPLLPTKPFSPNVDMGVTGTLTVDGETTTLEGARGQQGHLYGTRHAERWAWAHCSDFVDEEAVVQAITAQGRRGPFTTPFITSIGVRWEGKWIRLGKVSRQRDFGVIGRWNVDAGNRRYRLTGRIEAPLRALLRARYEDPGGTPRYCHNSEIASCRLVLFERKAGGFEEVALLESQGTTHAEWAGRTPAAGVEAEFVEAGG
jgi:hypothetical protein